MLVVQMLDSTPVGMKHVCRWAFRKVARRVQIASSLGFLDMGPSFLENEVSRPGIMKTAGIPPFHGPFYQGSTWRLLEDLESRRLVAFSCPLTFRPATENCETSPAKGKPDHVVARLSGSPV